MMTDRELEYLLWVVVSEEIVEKLYRKEKITTSELACLIRYIKHKRLKR